MTSEYYCPVKNLDPHIPILGEKGDFPDYFIEDYRIEDFETLEFNLGKPIPKNPVPGDFMFFPDLVVSQKVVDALKDLPQNTFQFIPATIDFDGDILENFWGFHIYAWLDCIDRENSKCKFETVSISFVEKLVLDSELLSEISLEDRLIFRMNEDCSRMLFHESVLEKLAPVNPSGITWVNLTEATTKTLF